MADTVNKTPVKVEPKAAAPTAPPARSLRHEIDRLFDEFEGFGRGSFPRAFFGADLLPRNLAAVDIVEKDKSYEVTAELPGLSEADIQVELVNGDLRIKGEKKEEKEEKGKDRYLSERRYGSFERRFTLPEGVDASKIDASFDKGVLKVTLPKTVDAQKAPKKIAVRTS